ncbi:hypothetical protein ETD83_20900 [Actinomadura soli]|uniref:Uncharacterized protein n=1 Tax=Actinomadura soli TaxID=2508997 RepID=A0A5C4J909_9ACTN|nr:hypothetical protein [Actinomadura soli]TMQ96815.1 hypothetical protein ETD83_20900 [Actinomadura soli]
MMAFTITQAGAAAAVRAAGPPAVPTAQEATALVVAAPAQQQAPTQLPGEAEGGTIMIVVIGGFLWYILKHKKAKPVHVIVSFAAGVLLAGSLFGLMARQVSASLGTGLQTMLGTVNTSGNGSGSGTGR